MIYAVLSNFNFVAKFTVKKNQEKRWNGDTGAVGWGFLLRGMRARARARVKI